MASTSATVSPQANSGALKRHEKMLDTIRGGTEKEGIALFAEEGYDVNTKVDYTFDDGKRYMVTPLAWAVRFKRPQLCRYLLANGADPYSNLLYDNYPLHEACNRGFSDVVRVFIEMKCDIDRVTGDLHSPLHIACMRGHVECARLLLQAGANRELRNGKGQTPLQVGVYHGQADLHQLFNHYGGDSKPKIQRRHSLHSPTAAEPHHLVKQVASMDCSPSHSHAQFHPLHPHSSRPQSMIIDYHKLPSYETGMQQQQHQQQQQQQQRTFTTDDVFSTTLQLPNGNMNRFRSHSNQNLASGSAVGAGGGSGSGFSPSSFFALPHTCSGSLAPPSNQVHVSPATSSVGLSLCSSSRPPNLLKQLSQASSSAADSPSPVERDGVKEKSKELGQTQRNSVQIHCPKESEPTPDVFPVEERPRLSPEKSPHHPSKRGSKREQYLGTPPFSSSATVPLRPKVAPCHSHSNPEFPLTTSHMSMDRNDRTLSYDDLYTKQRQHPCRTQSENKVLPSREKINNLSCQIYESLDQNWQPMLAPYTSGSYQHILQESTSPNPICEVMRRVITSVTVPPLNLSKVHLQTLMDLCCHTNTPQNKSYSLLHSSMTNSFSEREKIYDSPVAYLLSLGYRIIEKPLTVSFGVPSDGYMTLIFQLEAAESGKKKALLKVVAKIFDLKNKYESSTYHHSIPDESTLSCTSLSQVSSPADLLEVSLLSQLSQTLHPSVVELLASFKAYTSEQHEMFAQQMNPDNPKKMYATGRVADYMVLQSPKTNLREHLDIIKRRRQSLTISGDFPEEMVLSILSQVLLAVVHLVNNQIAHCAVSSDNVFINESDRNRVLLSNFSHAVQLNSQKLDLERTRQMQARLKAELSQRHRVFSPEVVQAVENSELENAFLHGELKTLFANNDTYAAACMVYSWFLSESHSFFHQDRSRPYKCSDIPYLSKLSIQCNHLLRKLVSYNHKDRLSPMEGAMACFVLIFGPKVSDMQTEEECYKWLLAETVQFYLRPVLVDSEVRDYTDPSSMLLCMYLTVASCNPRAVWEACRFLSKCS